MRTCKVVFVVEQAMAATQGELDALSCKPGWLKTPSGATCVKLFDDQKKSWYDARRACKSTDGDLVTIRDKDMSNFIKERFVYNNKNSMWIGLHKLSWRKKWHWLDEDKTPKYTDWYVQQRLPISRMYNMDICAFLKNKKKGEAAWHTWICASNRPYICEKLLLQNKVIAVFRSSVRPGRRRRGSNSSQKECRMADGSFLDIYHYRDGYTCYETSLGGLILISDRVLIVSQYKCFYQRKSFIHRTVLTFPYVCGDPHTCINGKWIPAIDQCRGRRHV
ncbi:macrophage mannose receptor 1 [Plakobranchus ocellatus]|uniref:Macrophage mannose receptor 1 n=1 Tax=Plakobranchus ocellatus TaxID=259542 RepID=A0AAV3ZGY9_9GAST|nr:macrophage mannose receptor 1 [Plakobranchus ocellatus]